MLCPLALSGYWWLPDSLRCQKYIINISKDIRNKYYLVCLVCCYNLPGELSFLCNSCSQLFISLRTATIYYQSNKKKKKKSKQITNKQTDNESLSKMRSKEICRVEEAQDTFGFSGGPPVPNSRR